MNVLGLAWLSCTVGIAGPPRDTCGNGVIDRVVDLVCPACPPQQADCPCEKREVLLEECDGDEVLGSCQAQGFFAGTLGCTATCTLDTSRCVQLDSSLSHGELGPPVDQAWAARGAGVIDITAQRDELYVRSRHPEMTLGRYGPEAPVGTGIERVAGHWAVRRVADGARLIILPETEPFEDHLVADLGDVDVVGMVGFQAGVVLGQRTTEGTQLVVVGRDRKVEKGPLVEGELLDMAAHAMGIMVATHVAGEVVVTAFTTKLEPVGSVPLGAKPTAMRLANNDSYQVAAFFTDAEGVGVRRFTAYQGLQADPIRRVGLSGVQLAAADYSGSREGAFAVFTDDGGTVHLVLDGKAEPTAHALWTWPGTQVVAATGAFERVYIVWNDAEVARLTRVPAPVR